MTGPSLHLRRARAGAEWDLFPLGFGRPVQARVFRV